MLQDDLETMLVIFECWECERGVLSWLSHLDNVYKRALLL